MNKVLKTIIVIPFIVVCLFVLAGTGYVVYQMATHCDVIFNIGNSFDEPATVYFEGKKMGRINPGDSKVFCLEDILTKTNTDLLVELKSDSGEILFFNLYSSEELTRVLESVTGEPEVVWV